MTRPARLALLTATLALLASGCGYQDPGYMAGAANESDTQLVIRDRTNKWLVPPRSVGYLFAKVGDPAEADPIEYEILDAATCLPLGEVTVEFTPEPKSFIVIGADLVAAAGPRGARVVREPLEPIEDCPGAADGWGLWVQNRTTSVYYVRSRNADEVKVAFISPRGNRLALTGRTEASTLELLDRDCNVLSSYDRTGFLHFRGTIEDDSMIVVPDVPPPFGAPEFGIINRCSH